MLTIVGQTTVERVIAHKNEVCLGSDHNMIFVRVRLRDRTLPMQEVEKRMRKDLDPEQLKRELQNCDCTELLQSNNVDVINGILETAIRGALDKFTPVKTVQVRRGYRSWVTEDLKNLMGIRDNLREAARASQNAEDWERYRKV